MKAAFIGGLLGGIFVVFLVQRGFTFSLFSASVGILGFFVLIAVLAYTMR